MFLRKTHCSAVKIPANAEFFAFNAIAFLTGQAYKTLSIFNRGLTMIALLVALRDFFIAVLIGWLGVSAEPADKQQKAEPSAQPAHTQLSLLG